MANGSSPSGAKSLAIVLSGVHHSWASIPLQSVLLSASPLCFGVEVHVTQPHKHSSRPRDTTYTFSAVIHRKGAHGELSPLFYTSASAPFRMRTKLTSSMDGRWWREDGPGWAPLDHDEARRWYAEYYESVPWYTSVGRGAASGPSGAACVPAYMCADAAGLPAEPTVAAGHDAVAAGHDAVAAGHNAVAALGATTDGLSGLMMTRKRSRMSEAAQHPSTLSEAVHAHTHTYAHANALHPGMLSEAVHTHTLAHTAHSGASTSRSPSEAVSRDLCQIIGAMRLVNDAVQEMGSAIKAMMTDTRRRPLARDGEAAQLDAALKSAADSIRALQQVVVSGSSGSISSGSISSGHWHNGALFTMQPLLPAATLSAMSSPGLAQLPLAGTLSGLPSAHLSGTLSGHLYSDTSPPTSTDTLMPGV